MRYIQIMPTKNIQQEIGRSKEDEYFNWKVHEFSTQTQQKKSN